MHYTITQADLSLLATAVNKMLATIGQIKLENTVMLCRKDIQRAVRDYEIIYGTSKRK